MCTQHDSKRLIISPPGYTSDCLPGFLEYQCVRTICNGKGRTYQLEQGEVGKIMLIGACSISDIWLEFLR